MNPTTKRLYKELLFMGRDYPMGFDFFRERLKKAFIKNRDVTDPEKLDQLHARAQFVLQELEAMYKLRKYRFLKKNYYDDNLDEEHDSAKIMKHLETITSSGSGSNSTGPNPSPARQNDEYIARAATILDPLTTKK